jgi:hypothetical protein
MLSAPALLISSLLAGLTLFLVGLAFFFLVPLIAPEVGQAFQNAALFRPWHGWTRAYMALHPFVYGFIFAACFLLVRDLAGGPGRVGLRGGLGFGLAVFLVGSLPVFALNFASFQVDAGVIVSWALQSLCQYLAAGAVLGLSCG